MQRNQSTDQDDSGQPQSTWLAESLRSLTRVVARRPQLTLVVVAMLSCAAIAWTACFLKFKTERADLLDPDAAFHQRWLDYTETFGDDSDMVVVVEADDPRTIKQVLDELGSQIKHEPKLFANVLYKFEPGKLREKGLQYLSPRQLEWGLERVAEYSPILRGRWDLIELQSLVPRLHYQISPRLTAQTSGQTESLLRHTDLLVTSLNRSLTDPSDFRSPWPDLVAVDRRLRDIAQQVVYFLNDEGTMGFLKAAPVQESDRFAGYSKSIGRLRELIADMSATYPHVRIGLTGIPVLENDEMLRSRSDMLTASLVSLVLVGGLLFLGFRGFRHPALALLMLAVGMAWAFGYTTLIVGHLNILSVSFAVILIGLGIDFAIHYLARYLELRHQGEQLRPALLNASASVGPGIVTAAATTAIAFFAATLTQFLGVAELGIISGGGILLCALATFVVLPALVALADQNVEPRKLPTPFQGDGLRWLTSRYPRCVLAASCAVVIGVGMCALRLEDGRVRLRTRYDYNLLNLQARGLESVEAQKRIFHAAQDSLLFAVSVADTPDEARLLRRKFEALPSVHHVEELASRLPPHPSRRTQLLVQAYGAQLAGLPAQPPAPRPSDPIAVGRAVESLYTSLRQSRNPAALRIARTLDQFLDRFEALSYKQQADFLDQFQYRAARALLAQFQLLAAASSPSPVSMDDLPAELTSRFISPEGKWLVQVYPKEQIWDIEPLSRFIADVRTVDPDVTGTPLQNYEASRQILECYKTAALYALAVVCIALLVDLLGRRHKLIALLPPLAVVLFAALAFEARRIALDPLVLVASYLAMAVAIAVVLDFRNLRDAMLAVVPPLCGGVLTFGILGLAGIDLNAANLIVLPLVLGIGVDDGVHVIHDFRQQRGRYRTSSSTMNAIVLTSLTSMIGFGSLMLAAHRGLYSVGLVLVIGVGCCLFVSLVILPAVLTLLSKPRAKEQVQSDEGSGSASKNRKNRAA